MPDLHGWITQQIDKAETTARAATDGPWIAEFSGEAGNCVIPADAQSTREYVARTQLYAAAFDAEHIALHDPTAVLRRCTADRRILARHRLDPDVHYEPACLGCGTYGDLELSVTDNLNECPELLDLAYAHGLTDEVLASLDQPVPPPMPERPEPGPGFRIGGFPARPASSVPPALRGPNWKATP